jgi:hypothetical protein
VASLASALSGIVMPAMVCGVVVRVVIGPSVHRPTPDHKDK